VAHSLVRGLRSQLRRSQVLKRLKCPS
jgi:hypothetical protein